MHRVLHDPMAGHAYMEEADVLAVLAASTTALVGVLVGHSLTVRVEKIKWQQRQQEKLYDEIGENVSQFLASLWGVKSAIRATERYSASNVDAPEEYSEIINRYGSELYHREAMLVIRANPLLAELSQEIGDLVRQLITSLSRHRHAALTGENYTFDQALASDLQERLDVLTKRFTTVARESKDGRTR